MAEELALKITNGPIGNRTRDLPACNAVPQPTASPFFFYAVFQFCLFLPLQLLPFLLAFFGFCIHLT
jgi:hypothetical protein